MKKILIFGITENPGGIESFLMNYYRTVDREKLHFDFLCNTEVVAYEEEIRSLGGTIYRVPARRDGRRPFHEALDRLFREHSGEYDAIWVNVCSLANIDYLAAAKRCGIPRRIIHCHNADNGDSFLRGLLHRANRLRVRLYATDFWSCSDGASVWFYGKDYRRRKNYRRICNAIAPERFAYDAGIRESYRRELGVEEKIVVGHVGRFHFQKNHKFLIEIFAGLKRRDDRYHLLLIGQGETQEEIRQRVRELSLTDSVSFLGIRADMAGLYQAMDLFVFPSVFEGLPVTLLEVQANGLPAVVSDAVPGQVKINDNLYFKGLNEPASAWAEWIDRRIKGQPRADGGKFAASEYNIYRQAQKLEDFFCGGGQR